MRHDTGSVKTRSSSKPDAAHAFVTPRAMQRGERLRWSRIYSSWPPATVTSDTEVALMAPPPDDLPTP